MGLFARMMVRLEVEADALKTIMIDVTFHEEHPTTAKPAGGTRERGLLIGCTKGGLNIKPHAVGDVEWRHIRLLLRRKSGQRRDRRSGPI